MVLGDLLSYELYAINMIDSWAKPQAGILYGNEETVLDLLIFKIISRKNFIYKEFKRVSVRVRAR